MNYLTELQPNPNNPRTIKDKEFDRLKQKIRSFPEMLEKRPIIYDETNTILGGNSRFLALRDLALTGFEIKDSYFSQVTNWSEEQKKQFLINDNISEGQWDFDILNNLPEFNTLPLEDWGINMRGFTEPTDPNKEKVSFEAKKHKDPITCPHCGKTIEQE